MDSEPSKSEGLAKGKLEELHHKSNSDSHEGAIQGLSESVPMSVHTYYTFPPNKYFSSLPPVFVGILFCEAWTLSLTAGLVARIWCSHCHSPEARLHAVAGQGHP